MADAQEGTTRKLGAVPVMSLARVELHVVEGPNRGEHALLSTGTLRVGSSPTCDLPLSDETVSRLHFELRATDGTFVLTDLGSTNGTFVDGVRVLAAQIASGAIVRCGRTAIRVDVGDDVVRIPISDRVRFGDMIGGSTEMRRIYAILERVAPTDTTVLVQGETGTGKELVARALHQGSPRASGPFVAVDCGAIADNLVESELFGHARGAFTGAVSHRVGLFEQAAGGTLLLDEVGELPIALQPKLLRVLESREVRPLGTNVARRVDVRIVAATNRPLARAVNDGTFREDLFYRLAVVQVVLPPLRARREDVVPLARHFHAAFAGPDAPFPEALIPTLMARGWPGNVRELRNFVERSVSMGWVASADAAPETPVPPGIEALVPTDLPLKKARAAWVARFETLYIQALLRRTGGNVTRTAQLAGVNRRWLQRLIASLGLRAAETGGDDADE
jgi:transcriptional regulator with PAS, ATPase and Fis domain